MSCGPTNALQKLSNHTQLDRSLQADQQHRVGAQRSGFRSGGSNQLEAEFQQHLQQNQQQSFNPSFNPVFQQNMRQQEMIRMQQNNQQQSGGWANDFASLSISGNQQNQAPLQRSNDWSSQFMTSTLQQQQFNQQLNHQPQLQFNQANNMLNSQFQQQHLLSQSQSQNFRTEHQELHDLDKFHNELENEFSKLENEFKPEEIEEPILKKSNEEFKSVAKQVANVMNTSNDSKFANSKFLQLMNMVSIGQVELNEDETKLVNNNGEDIHQQQLNENEQPNFEFLKNHNAHGGDLQNDFEKTHKDASLLPDPLAGITAEDLSSPFNAAKRVGQLHGERYSWDDGYNDYKNDDPSF